MEIKLTMTNRFLLLLFLSSSISKAQNFPQVFNSWGVNDSISVKYSRLWPDSTLKTLWAYNRKFIIDSNLHIGFDYWNYESVAGVWHPNNYRKISGDTLKKIYQLNNDE